MADILSIKIDVTKIDKNKLFKGEKGVYLDAVILLKDEPDQYNNIGMITQSVTKEEREKGIKGAILGNAKRIGVTQKPSTPQPAAPTTPPPTYADGLPF